MCAALSDRRRQVCVTEVVAFEQQRFSRLGSQRVREAVAEVQPGWVAAALAKIPVGVSGDPRLRGSDGFHAQGGLSHELVETTTGDGVGWVAQNHRAL